MVYWVWLRELKGIGAIIEKRLLDHFNSPEEIYMADKCDLLKVNGVGESLAEKIVMEKDLQSSYKILEEVKKKNIKLLTYLDPLYPKIAKKYSNAPTLLYYKGHIKNNINSVGIVGSRRCSEYGKEIVMEASKFLANNNITVISGLAKGIDGYAHIACLKNNGYTLAFLGSGVDIFYPSEHRELMEKIIEKGAVISEYPPGVKVKKEYFPKRNGLISSWSQKLLVVEAAEKSGALITAKIMEKLNRPIYAAPHSIYSKTGVGTNLLIGQGANLYMNPNQLLFGGSFNKEKAMAHIESEKSKSEEYNNEGNISNISLSELEKSIIRLIINGYNTFDGILIELKLDKFELIEILSTMEILGLIKIKPGGKYICNINF